MAKQLPSTPTPILHLAEILSDLVSLRVCDPAAAIALVSACPNPTSNSTTTTEEPESNPDADLKRAEDLVELHYKVKEAHRRGELGRGLVQARVAVERAVGG